MKKHVFRFVWAVVFCVLITAKISVNAQSSTLLNEGFESGGKTSYAAASINLNSGSWYLDDALIGSTTSDRRTGSYAARVRELGKLRMNFNVASAGTISIQHARFGSDGNSSWELWYSTDNGATWVKFGSTVNTTSTSLTTVNFTINYPSAIRFEIRKVSGAANRVNFDNISITAYSAGSTSVHLTMGNPSGAVASVNQPNNYLMVKPQYVLSYNRDYGRPNWVSWHLDSSWLGSTPRQDDFRADTSLPSGWYRVQPSDYTGSGYDRGHMCPSGDRTKSVTDNSATFLMTNMIPQAPTNNRETWENLESYSRYLANSGYELYIIAGGEGVIGYIGNGHVAVPAYTWKVIMVLPKGDNDLARVNTSTRLIAVWIPNNNNVSPDWRQYRVSIDYVEAQTGYDFFSNVPEYIQAQIESVVDSY